MTKPLMLNFKGGLFPIDQILSKRETVFLLDTLGLVQLIKLAVFRSVYLDPGLCACAKRPLMFDFWVRKDAGSRLRIVYQRMEVSYEED